MHLSLRIRQLSIFLLSPGEDESDELLRLRENNHLLSLARKLYEYGAIRLDETGDHRTYTIFAVIPEDRLKEVDTEIAEDSLRSKTEWCPPYQAECCDCGNKWETNAKEASKIRCSKCGCGILFFVMSDIRVFLGEDPYPDLGA